MLIQFSVANYKAIAEEQVFSMLPAKGSSHLLETGNRYFPQVLRVGALFGANGSGKTTFLDAIRFVDYLVSESGKHSSQDKIPVSPFKLDRSFSDRPSRFEVVFAYETQVWRYGFEVDAAAVRSEWLYCRPPITGRENKLFVRTGSDISLGGRFGLGSAFLEKVTAKNQLLLSKLDQLSHDATSEAYFWITVCMRSVLGASDWFKLITASRLHSNQDSEQIIELLKAIGMGFTKLEISERQVPEDSPEAAALLKSDRYLPGDLKDGMQSFLRISFMTPTRDGESVPIEFDEESLGTRALFGLAGIIVDTLRSGVVLLIDELNQSFHPEFLRFIVELFRSPESNKNGAQLIFSAHDTSVMSILERDELWIAEKRSDGASVLYSLAEIGSTRDGGPRRRGAFGKQYLENKYGGLPRIDLIRGIRAMSSLGAK